MITVAMITAEMDGPLAVRTKPLITVTLVGTTIGVLTIALPVAAGPDTSEVPTAATMVGRMIHREADELIPVVSSNHGFFPFFVQPRDRIAPGETIVILTLFQERGV